MLNHFDAQYHSLLKNVLYEGIEKDDRTGTGTLSTFGHTLTLDLSRWEVPFLTTKKIFTKGVIGELLWFLRGDTNIEWLNERGIHFWDNWADGNGDLGPIYGRSWRYFGMGDDGSGPYIDQIQNIVHLLKEKPYSRRILLEAWNPIEIENSQLPPCHKGFQLWVEPKKDRKDKLHMLWNQRSVDTFLGLPFNMASYSILLFMFCYNYGFSPGGLKGMFGDVHIYKDHIDQVKEILGRDSRSEPPKIDLKKKVDDLSEYEIEDIGIKDYRPHSKINAPISV